MFRTNSSNFTGQQIIDRNLSKVYLDKTDDGFEFYLSEELINEYKDLDVKENGIFVKAYYSTRTYLLEGESTRKLSPIDSPFLQPTKIIDLEPDINGNPNVNISCPTAIS